MVEPRILADAIIIMFRRIKEINHEKTFFLTKNDQFILGGACQWTVFYI